MVVYTKQFILKNTLIEVSVLVIDKELGKQLLHIFPWSRLEKCIVLNEFTYCNSSDVPNLKIKSIDRITLTKTFVTLRDIEQDEEIFLKYLK